MPANQIVKQIVSPPKFLIRNAVNAWWRWQVAQKFLSEIALAPGCSVIDIACSRGWLTRRVAEAVREGRVVGVDRSGKKIRRAIRRCAGLRNVEFYVGELEVLPWEGDSFDCVTCLDSFYDYPNPGAALTEMLRILKPGGKLFLGVRRGAREVGTRRGWRSWLNLARHSRSPHHYVRYLIHSGFLNVSQKAHAEYLLFVGTKA